MIGRQRPSGRRSNLYTSDPHGRQPSSSHRVVASFWYNSPPVVVTNTDYDFIRLVDKPNGKDWR